MNNIRICLLTSSYPRFEGDIAGNFIRELCKELVPHGFRFTVVAPADVKYPRPLNDRDINVTRFNYMFPHRWQTLAYGDGIEENLYIKPLRSVAIPTFLLSFITRALLVSRGCDIIWSHWLLPAGLVGEITARLARKPHCITVHSAAPIRLLRYMRFFIRDSSKIAAVSRRLQEHLTNVLGRDTRQVHYMPMGVRLPTHLLRSDKTELRKKYGLGDEFIILFMGRLTRIKGLHTLIGAARGLERTLLVIAGEGHCKKDLIKKARRLNAPVRFEGFLTGAKKIDWLALCDIFAAPSLFLPGGRSEGLPVSVLEALAAGKPVVASDTGGLNEVITDRCNGLLVPPGNEAALREGIETLRKNPKLRNRMSKNTLKASSEYTISASAKRYAQLFKSCLHSFK